MGAVLHVSLDGVYGNDRLVVIMERVMVGRHIAPDALYLSGIQAYERYRKTLPHFLLKLVHHALDRDDQYALSFPTGYELAHQDAGFWGFAQADSVSNQYTLLGTSQAYPRRLQLVGNQIHYSFVPDMQKRISRYHLPPLTFKV